MSAGPVDEAVVRALAPVVLGVLGRRGVDIAAAEDALQEALVAAYETWDSDSPRDAKGWLVTVAWRKHLDVVRSESSRRAREERVTASRRPDR